MTEIQLKNNHSRQDRAAMLRGMQKKLIMRAVLIITTILLTGVLLFTLTAAWYTNIVGTDGLSFTAKQWNFDGKIEIDGTVVAISPGDSGIVPMTISNRGTELATASVTVSKAGFSDEEMKQRIFFYVDAPYYRNNERMERVYVSAYSSYIYTLFPQSDLVLTESVQDSHPLEWEWVYDVLGYYVMGQFDSTQATMDVDEYLRPIEYDYDILTTTFDEYGFLTTTDGQTTTAELLAAISANDGYEGEIDADQRNGAGYYPVCVNDDGYGVWAYLCTYDEIVDNSAYDTQVGTGENNPQCPVTVTVTGSNSNGGAVEVSDPETLAAILVSTTHASVKLTQNITLPEQVPLVTGSRVEIDLDGYTLTSEASRIFNAAEGSKITINGGDDPENPGRIVGNGESGTYGILATGAEVELNNVCITGVEEGIKVVDHQNDLNTTSIVHLVDCTIDAAEDALWLYGNNSDGMTTVILERCQLYGRGYVGIYCNGSYPGLNITVTDSHIEGCYAGIYHPQADSTMTLKNCTIIGTNDAGIVVKGGTVNIEDCVITANGPFETWATYPNGFMNTGAGVYIEGTYARSITVNISGDTVVTSQNSEALRFTLADSYTENEAKFVLSGGTYTSAKTAEWEGETVTIPSIIDQYLASGCTTAVTETDTTVTYVVTNTAGDDET